LALKRGGGERGKARPSDAKKREGARTEEKKNDPLPFKWSEGTSHSKGGGRAENRTELAWRTGKKTRWSVGTRADDPWRRKGRGGVVGRVKSGKRRVYRSIGFLFGKDQIRGRTKGKSLQSLRSGGRGIVVFLRV